MLRLIQNESIGDSGFPDRDKMPARIMKNLETLELWK